MESKFELQFEDNEYYLVDVNTNDTVATTDKVLLKKYDGYMKKLSIKNCEAIANGYDLDELISVELKKLPYEKHVDDGQFNDGQLAGFELGAEWGFQKALEILADKKFSEIDLYRAFSINSAGNNTTMRNFFEQTVLPMFNDNAWLVEICCYIGNGDKESDSFKDPIVTNTGIPKLDENGCLILRRI